MPTWSTPWANGSPDQWSLRVTKGLRLVYVTITDHGIGLSYHGVGKTLDIALQQLAADLLDNRVFGTTPRVSFEST